MSLALLKYSIMFVPDYYFLVGRMLTSKARGLHKFCGTARIITQVGSFLTRKHYTNMKKPFRDKHYCFILALSATKKKVL
jgi:hypothetical protein